MSTIFLHPKRKTYYHRSNVPASLQRFLKGRAEIWRSLKTSDKAEAKVRSVQWDSRVHRLDFVEAHHNFNNPERDGEPT